jgi:hypothetical protein
MHYLNTDEPQKLLDAINATDYSLVFFNEKSLISAMHSISFNEFKRVGNGIAYSCIAFQGLINSQNISLLLMTDINNSNDKSYYLTTKMFYNELDLLHRENDLPAILEYNIHERFLQSKCFSYYLDGNKSRINKKDPIRCNFFNEGVQYVYHLPEKIKQHDIFAESLSLTNNKISHGHFHFGSFELCLSKIKDVLPDIDRFTLEEFVNLNNNLTLQEKKLLEMVLL